MGYLGEMSLIRGHVWYRRGKGTYAMRFFAMFLSTWRASSAVARSSFTPVHPTQRHPPSSSMTIHPLRTRYIIPYKMAIMNAEDQTQTYSDITRATLNSSTIQHPVKASMRYSISDRLFRLTVVVGTEPVVYFVAVHSIWNAYDERSECPNDEDADLR